MSSDLLKRDLNFRLGELRDSFTPMHLHAIKRFLLPSLRTKGNNYRTVVFGRRVCSFLDGIMKKI